MATKVTMPQMGFDMTEGKVARWLKKIGDAVKQGDPVVEIETDKVNIEAEAQGDGILREVIVSEGATVPVGALIGIIGAPDEDLTAIKAEAGLIAESASDGPTAAKSAAPAQPIEPTVPTTAPASEGDGRIKISPLARRIAQEKGLNLASLNGTGPGGRIVKRDIDAALTAMPITAAPVTQPVEPVKPIGVSTPAAPLAPAMLKAEEFTPTKLRQTIAKRMTASKQSVPHFYITVEVDMIEALALRAKLNAIVGDEGKISVNDLVIKATALALTRFPALNASYNGETVVRHGAVNMGIAVALEQGLITVVVTDADRKPLSAIAREARDIATRAKNGKARPEELQGSTFTISNLGMFGEVDSFAAIINPPEAAILAVGTTRDVPVVKDGQIVPGKTMKMTISADHRVTDGAEAAKFMAEVKRNLEEPLRLLV